MKLSIATLSILCTLLFSACSNTGNQEKEGKQSAEELQQEAQSFIDDYSKQYADLQYKLAKAEWASNTRIIPGDTMNAFNSQKAGEAFANFTGSAENIKTIEKHLEQKDSLKDLQVRQLERMLYEAANNSNKDPELLSQRIKAETMQNEKLFGFDYQAFGQKVSTNQIDSILKADNDVERRLEVWRQSKEVGKDLKDGLTTLRMLRNKTVQSLGYDDYFSYQVSDYGMSRKEMMNEMKKVMGEIWPLYRELHTFTRYKLAEKYGQEVPEMLPAHWLPNRWGQDWSSLIEVEGLDLDAALEDKNGEWIVRQGEKFYESLGFASLPQTFYTKSSLYPAPKDADYKKNNHASAWHMDLEQDVRCLMSVTPTADWYETVHHEFGHIYYYLAYSRPEVPVLLRGGANRAYHEAIGSMLGLAAMQKPFLKEVGLIEGEAETDEMQTLLKEAMNYIVFMPWGAGVMPSFEHDLYAENLSENEFNKRWWKYKREYQGIIPPAERDEQYCDPTSKTHINNDAAQYYDYAMSFVLLFQFHDYISKNILEQDPHATNYYGNKELGKYLTKVLGPGATSDWRELLKETTGEELSARAMLDYFSPLMQYLKEANKGRKHTLREEF